MLFIRYFPMLFAATVVASPAYASAGGVALPEPSGLLLLGLGVAGVVVGRRFSRKKIDE